MRFKVRPVALRRCAVLAVGLTAVAVVLTTATTSSANIGGTGNVQSRSIVAIINGNTHGGEWEWRTNQSGSNSYASLSLNAGDFANNRCVDIWFDWWTHGDGHFDARAVRVCKPSGQRSSSNGTTTHFDIGVDRAVRTLDGVQKLGLCLWQQDNDVLSNCVNDSSIDPGQQLPGTTVNPNVPNFVTVCWYRKQDGTTNVFGDLNYPLDDWR